MWRRPIRRTIGPGAPARVELARARELFQQGDFGAAAPVFEQLARGAEQRGMLDAAGDLRLQLARCYLELSKPDLADDEARHALGLFLRARRPMKVRRLLPKVIAALEQHGRHAEAQELQAKAEQLLGPMPAGAGPTGLGRAGTPAALPGQCSNCGAPLKPSEVNWIGSRSAECPYCGSVVSA